MRHGFEEILQLAKTAAKWDLDSDEGYEKFRFFARENGIKEENFAYYLNAYQAAGESGLKALNANTGIEAGENHADIRALAYL